MFPVEPTARWGGLQGLCPSAEVKADNFGMKEQKTLQDNARTRDPLLHRPIIEAGEGRRVVWNGNISGWRPEMFQKWGFKVGLRFGMNCTKQGREKYRFSGGLH